jgi:SepF-like predicted cell division protein (DUF552 family)
MRRWLFRLLFPRHDAAKDLEQLRREYERKCSTLRRSPLDESVWVSKFTALERDYAALEKVVAELREENWNMNWQIMNSINVSKFKS